MKNPLIVIAGPTACRKTKISVSLAKDINASVISADSMQVYKGLDIGTAKIRPEEMQGVPHYMIDELEPDEEFNIYLFKKKALGFIDDINNVGRLPMIVGGTGFYIQSVLYDIDFSDEGGDRKYRKKLEEIADKEGVTALHRLLEEKDAESAEAIHENNVKRVIRALEYHHETGKKLSAHNSEQKQKISPFNFAYFVLNMDREMLYRRINTRVDLMVSAGLIDEVDGLLKKGVSAGSLSMQGIGYKEVCEYLAGNSSKEDAINAIKQNTRHFAKRQLTWFRHERDAVFIELDEYADTEAVKEHMKSILKEKGIV